MKQLQLVVLILFFFLLPGLKAQQNHFIYIQTDHKQPFYVKLDKKLYSSSASGYLVVPKLTNGNYNLVIGFPKSEWTEQNLVCTIENDDVGYLLKNFDSKGWGLFNLQTLDVVMVNDGKKVNNVEVVNNTDAFSTMLSSVVNDSTIRQTELVKEEVKPLEKKTEEATMVATVKEIEPVHEQVAAEAGKVELKSTGTIESNSGNNGKEVENTGTPNEIGDLKETKSVITRNLLNNNADGTEMIFFDEQNGKRDTIRVFIPVDKKPALAVEEKPAAIEKPKEEQNPATARQEEKARDARFLDIELPNPNKQQTEEKHLENKPTENKSISSGERKATDDKTGDPVNNKSVMINSDCKNFATNDDFLKLRKKMAGETNDDDMIILAKKLFKTKCFTVEQVKNLSVLFLKDSGKYAFFDSVYPFVADSHNFGTLQTQLSETYYINRFQVMIRH